MPASVAARLAGMRADSSIFYYLDGQNARTLDSLKHVVDFISFDDKALPYSPKSGLKLWTSEGIDHY